MSLLTLKLILTPTLLIMATLAARRWGPVVAGWIVGLPLTSGPVSVFLALEHGSTFAVASASATLLATLAVVAFCITYSRVANRLFWLPAVILALCGYFSALMLFNAIALPLLPAIGIVVLGISAALAAEGAIERTTPAIPAPWWDIPFRVIAATSVVLLITAVSGQLGPRLSGLLSSFPLFTCVMATFSHRLCGTANARLFLHGMIIGSYAYAAFFVSVILLLPHLHLSLVYLLAAASAGCVNFTLLWAIGLHAKKSNGAKPEGKG
jgi:hypothetical protein